MTGHGQVSMRQNGRIDLPTVGNGRLSHHQARQSYWRISLHVVGGSHATVSLPVVRQVAPSTSSAREGRRHAVSPASGWF